MRAVEYLVIGNMGKIIDRFNSEDEAKREMERMKKVDKNGFYRIQAVEEL